MNLNPCHSCIVKSLTGDLFFLGSGGGNNASHMKKHFKATLVDIAPGMLAVSQKLNPECEHIKGDMRTVRLGRQFDVIFIQDAIVYMKSETDLYHAIQTAYVHCNPGGAALFAPDHTRETFKEHTGQGGHDAGEQSLRYLEWAWDPDPEDNTYVFDMVYLLRQGKQAVRCIHDRHECGLFSKADWIRLITQAGFQASSLPFEHSELEPGSACVFLGMKPINGSVIEISRI
jgi:hypothetical protein